jgi:hypothetical protein
MAPVTKNVPYKENSSLVNQRTESNVLALCDTPNAPVVSNINAVIAPDIMNTHVLIILLTDNLPIPDNPCPDVHPFPATLPTPTNNPANARLVELGTKAKPPFGMSACENPSAGIHLDAVNKPAKNGRWFILSLNGIFLCVNARKRPLAPTALPQFK